ncbi:MAG: LysM peptidoglycan-binding domain-containing protein [Agathobacter sp.]|uniref:cell division suppressor protein YneA n=1 Tax=Agathobacter sp. TaxID=2021311 RepID=UPI002586A3BD|nr:LysM peptidoglycan-binding domain-containing protein [Agathobacter sp.]MCR5677432.1 LysM peptidoglycan-binding domain-containing protein [Agathobacter sp.]
MRAYNTRISAKANESLSRREAIVSTQKRMIFVVVILCISLLILGSSTYVAFAKADNQHEPVKQYISIQIQSGETLWSIASEYVKDTNVSKEEYIAEVTSVNNLKDSQIHSGQYLIIPEYVFDEQ